MDIASYIVKMCEALFIVLKSEGIAASAASSLPQKKAYTVYGLYRNTVYAFAFLSLGGAKLRSGLSFRVV